MNTRIIQPIRHDVKNKIERPLFSLTGNVVAGMTVQNEDLNLFTEQKFSPETIAVANIEGMGNVKVRWIVKGNPRATVKVLVPKEGQSQKK
jgi:hypothetical protein